MILRQLLITAIVSISGLTLMYSNVFAEESTENLSPLSVAIYYTKNNCQNCDLIQSTIERKFEGTRASLDVRNTSDEDIMEEYNLVIESCEITSKPYPLIVTQEGCETDTTKYIDIADSVLALAEEREEEEAVEQEESEEVAESTEEEETPEETEEQVDNTDPGQTLSEYLNTNEPEPMDPLIFVAMLIIPTGLVGILIYMIKKLQL